MLTQSLKLVIVCILCLPSLKVSAQSALSAHLGHTTTFSSLNLIWGLADVEDGAVGTSKGLSFDLQYRWYKNDRGFRTLTLQHFSGSEKDVNVIVFNTNTFEYEKRAAPFRVSYTTLHYDAAFALFKSEIDDKYMPYIGSGYFLGVSKCYLGLSKVGSDLHEEFTNIMAGIDLKLGMDYNVNLKWAVNAELKGMTALGDINYGFTFQVGALYKLY